MFAIPMKHAIKSYHVSPHLFEHDQDLWRAKFKDVRADISGNKKTVITSRRIGFGI